MRDTRNRATRKNKTGAAMKHASTREVFDYWNERRGTRLAPERGDIEPGAIRHVLGDTFILAHEGRGGPHFRLAGTRLCALFCRELKGAAFVDLWAEDERDAIRDHIEVIAHETAGLVAGISGRNADGASIDLELLLLPLVHRDRGQARLLGVLAPHIVPYWLGASPLAGLRNGTSRYLGPTVETADAPRLVPAPEGTRLRHGLTVYDGGRS
jgi:hypothetical protein